MARERDVRFRIGARDDTARGTRSAAQRFRDLGKAIARSVGVVAVGAIAGLSLALSRAAERLDELAKTAKELQIDPSFLRQIQLAGSLAGVTDQQLVRLISRLRSGTTEVNKGLEELGLNLEGLGEGSALQQLLVVVRRLEDIEDSSERAAAATAVAGDRLGRSLLRLAAAGSADLARTADRFEVLAGATNEAASSAEEWQDAGTRAGAVWDSFLERLINRFSGAGGVGNFLESSFLFTFTKIFGTNEQLDQLVNGSAGRISESLGDAFEAASDRGLAASEKVFEEAEKKLKELEAQRKKDLKEAQELARAQADEYDRIIAGLQAIVDLEDERRRKQLTGEAGVLGQDAPVLGRTGGASQAQQLLDFAQTKRQTAAVEELVRIARDPRSGAARYGG